MAILNSNNTISNTKSSTKNNDFSNALAINFTHTLIASAVGVLVPLYMLQKDIQVEKIGMIFAVLSVVMLIFRYIFAVVADIIGTRLIFLLSSITHVITIVIYMFATQPLHFSIGKTFEGLRASTFWAVNRTEIYNIAKTNAGKNASLISSLRMFGAFLGRAIIGIVLLFITIENAFLAVIIISTLLFFYSLKIKNHTKQSEKIKLNNFISPLRKKRAGSFWIDSVVLSINAFYEASVVPLILPIYLITIVKVSAAEVGIALALYSIAYTVAGFLAIRKNLSMHKVVYATIMFGALPFLLLVNVDFIPSLFIIMLLGVGAGFGNVIDETSMAKVVKKSSAVSTDISVLVVPYRIIEFITLIVFGFAVAMFGFYPIFIFLGISMAAYSILAWKYILNKN